MKYTIDNHKHQYHQPNGAWSPLCKHCGLLKTTIESENADNAMCKYYEIVTGKKCVHQKDEIRDEKVKRICIHPCQCEVIEGGCCVHCSGCGIYYGNSPQQKAARILTNQIIDNTNISVNSPVVLKTVDEYRGMENYSLTHIKSGWCPWWFWKVSTKVMPLWMVKLLLTKKK